MKQDSSDDSDGLLLAESKFQQVQRKQDFDEGSLQAIVPTTPSVQKQAPADQQVAAHGERSEQGQAVERAFNAFRAQVAPCVEVVLREEPASN